MATAPKTARPSHCQATSSDTRAEFEARRRDRYEWRKWYGLARWKRLRAAQLAAYPLCCMCEAEGQIEVATVADHVKPHHGDRELFWGGALQSLCAHHHNRVKQREEARGA
jgi:hypothetical protein